MVELAIKNFSAGPITHCDDCRSGAATALGNVVIPAACDPVGDGAQTMKVT